MRILSSTTGIAAVAVLNAILSLLQNADEKTAPKGDIVTSLREALFKCFSDFEDLIRAVAARCFGPFAALQSPEEQTALLSSLLAPTGDWKIFQSGLLAVSAIVEVLFPFPCLLGISILIFTSLEISEDPFDQWRSNQGCSGEGHCS